MIRVGVNVNVNKGDCLFLGIVLYSENFELVKILIKVGVDVDYIEISFLLLIVVCYNGYLKSVE